MPSIEKQFLFDFREYLALMADLMVVAFQADLTRISTLMFAREAATMFTRNLEFLTRTIL